MSYETLLQQNLAAESDRRTTAFDEVWWTQISDDYAVIAKEFHWALEDAGITPRLVDDDETVFTTRITMAVCPLCDGRGQYVNPSIDAHGLSREDFDEDPDFEESYFRGDYNIRCKLCEGEKVVPVPLDQRVAEVIDQVVNDRYDSRAEMLAEMRMGA